MGDVTANEAAPLLDRGVEHAESAGGQELNRVAALRDIARPVPGRNPEGDGRIDATSPAGYFHGHDPWFCGLG
jgi:hypothetical protein